MDIDQEQPTTVEPTAVEQAEKAKEQGNLAFKAGKHSEAVRHYTTATDLVSSTNPEAAAPYYANRAAASMSLKLYPSALSDMQSSLALSPPPPPPKNLLRLARCQLATAQTGPARSTLTPLLSTPLAPDATKELARVDAVESSVSSIQAARSRDDPSMVLIGLDRLSRFSDGGLSASTEWTCWRIEALLAKSRLNEASDAVTALLRSSGGDKNPEAWWWRGLVLFHQANLSQSVKAFQESLRLDPDLTKSRTMMRFVKKLEGLKEDGNKAFKAGDTDLAIEKYSSATSEPLPEAPGVGSKMPVAVRTTLLSNTSAALLKRRRAGDFDRALATADEIVALDPDHFKAWRTKGRARVALAKEGDENDGDGSSQQVRVQKWEDAVRDLEQAEDKAPNEEERAGLKKEIRDAKTELKKAKAKDYCPSPPLGAPAVAEGRGADKILGVSRTADDTEIKRAFKKQSLQHHPDKGGDEEKFKEINEAFSVLSDPQKRRMVDQGSQSSLHPPRATI